MGLTISQKEISLDLQNQGFTNTIYSQEGDADSRQLVISLFDDGEKYIISPSSVLLLQGTRADGAVVNRYIDIFNDNKITIIFREEELNVKGIAKYKIVIKDKDGDKKLSSFYFKIKVYENVYNSDGIIANPSVDVLEELIETTGKLVEKTNDTIKRANEKINEIDDILTPISDSEIDAIFSMFLDN